MIQETTLNAFFTKNETKSHEIRQKILKLIENSPNGLTDKEILRYFSPQEIEVYQPKARRHELAYGLQNDKGEWIILPHQIVNLNKIKRVPEGGKKKCMVWYSNWKTPTSDGKKSV